MPGSDNNSNGHAVEGQARLEELISSAKAGSTSALGQALHLCRGRLLRSAREQVAGRLRLETGASDVVQDTFVNATRGFARFRGRYAGEFVSWLRTIFANRLAEIARRVPANGHDSAVDGPAGLVASESLDASPSPSSLAGNQEYTDLIRAALGQLGPRDRRALGLRFERGMTFPQIGQELGVSADAARMLFTRAVKRLRRRMTFELPA